MKPSIPQSGSIVDRYTVEAPLGEGGMAMVYRVRHTALGTMHALKVLTLSSPKLRERLRQEGQLQARLRHPNVVAVTDVIDLGGSDGLILEYVDGPSLEARLKGQRLSLLEADELASGILAGVGEAHRLGCIHRDLKPANVLLKRTGFGHVPKVADFGLAKVFREGVDSGRLHTRTGSTMGTPQYMSPEQIRDARNVGPRSDIFSLGAILYEMVTGQRAFDGDDLLEVFNAVASGRYRPVRELVPDVPDRMERAIQVALRVDPAHRPDSVATLGAIWSGALSLDLAPGVPPPPSAEASSELTVWLTRNDPTGSLATRSSPSVETLFTRVVPHSHGPWPAWLDLGGGMILAALFGMLAVLFTAGQAWFWLRPDPLPREEVLPVLELPAPPPPEDR